MKIISQPWLNKITEALNNGEKIDETISYNPAAQWLVTTLMKRDRTFKLYPLGAGVKRITTDTDTCPCCRKKL